MTHLIVFSHLRWNFVFQRPQHLLSRLAKRWQVIFVEEPMPRSERNELEVFEAMHEDPAAHPQHRRGADDAESAQHVRHGSDEHASDCAHEP